MNEENKTTSPEPEQTSTTSTAPVTPPVPPVQPSPDTSRMEEQLKVLSETNIKLTKQLEEYNQKLVFKEQPKKEEIDFVELFKK